MKKMLGLCSILVALLFLTTGAVLVQREGKEEGAAEAPAEASSEASTAASTEAGSAKEAPQRMDNKTCPVDKVAISEPGANTVEYKGKVYNVCCPGCKEEFLKDPGKYAAIANDSSQETLAEEEAE